MATCCCIEWDKSNTGIRQCPEHFRIFNGDKRLTSVGRIVGASFPLPPGIPADVLESARERGSEVDRLFAAYVLGNLKAIPAGTRNDSRELFLKAKAWYDRQNFKAIEVQVLLGCEDHGGVLDFRFDGVPLDLKCTYNVEHSARMQVAAYGRLDWDANADTPDDVPNGNILHVTERYKEARLVPLVREDFHDWEIILRHFRMLQRRGKKMPDTEEEPA